MVDIARAHVLSLKYLEENKGTETCNLGNGRGYSVTEVIETAEKVTGVRIKTTVRPRRPGDPAVLVASSEMAKARLGWQPEFPELEDIIESAWQWQRKHPHGYG